MTKAERRQRVKALCRLAAQAKLNAGDATVGGRTGEGEAWSAVADALAQAAERVTRGESLCVQTAFWGARV